MYILNLFGRCLVRIGQCLTCQCSSSSPSANNDETSSEATPLVGNTGQHHHHHGETTTTTTGRGTMIPLQRVGLSGEFTSYFDSQKGTIFMICHVITYFILGVVAYSHVFESYSYIDCLYFAVCTFTTVGYGDVVPTKDSTRVFTCFYALYGIFILGSIIGLVGEGLVDRANSVMEATRENARSKVATMFAQPNNDDDNNNDGNIALTERQIKAQKLMEQKGEKKTMFQTIMGVILMELPIIAIILAIALVMGYYEGWTIISSIYFGVITASTVGYGDLTPQEEEVRLWCVIFMPLTVAVFCEVVGRVADTYFEYLSDQEEEAFLSRQLTLADLDQMDVNDDGQVTYGEFLEFLLVAMQRVEPEDIKQLRDIFNKLDEDGSGYLDKEDLKERSINSMRHVADVMMRSRTASSDGINDDNGSSGGGKSMKRIAKLVMKKSKSSDDGDNDESGDYNQVV